MRATTRDVRGLGRIVRGQVSSSGGIVSGTGFTVVRTGLGLYTVTFTPAFPSPPTCVALGFAGSTFYIYVPVTASQFQAASWRADNATYIDSAFQFVAMEANPA